MPWFSSASNYTLSGNKTWRVNVLEAAASSLFTQCLFLLKRYLATVLVLMAEFWSTVGWPRFTHLLFQSSRRTETSSRSDRLNKQILDPWAAERAKNELRHLASFWIANPVWPATLTVTVCASSQDDGEDTTWLNSSSEDGTLKKNKCSYFSCADIFWNNFTRAGFLYLALWGRINRATSGRHKHRQPRHVPADPAVCSHKCGTSKGVFAPKSCQTPVWMMQNW